MAPITEQSGGGYYGESPRLGSIPYIYKYFSLATIHGRKASQYTRKQVSLRKKSSTFETITISEYQKNATRYAIAYRTLHTHARAQIARSLSKCSLSSTKKATSTHHRDEGDSHNQQRATPRVTTRKEKKRKRLKPPIFGRPPFLWSQSALSGVGSTQKEKHTRWVETRV